MTYFDFPKNEMTGYSPKAFIEGLFKPALFTEKGTEDEKIAILLNSKNKNKKLTIIENEKNREYLYKQLMEMYYSSIYALAINKQWGIKFDIIASDSPDIFFVNEADENDRVAIEIYEAYNFEEKEKVNQVDIAKEVKKLNTKKGNKNYPMKSRLLVINRINSTVGGFNISEYCRELNRYIWSFSCIILCVFTKTERKYTFFHLYPVEMKDLQFNFSTKDDGKYWY